MPSNEFEEYVNLVLDRLNEIRILLDDDKNEE